MATPVGCVVNRPTPPQSLLERVPDETWNELAPGARARALEVSAIDLMTYIDEYLAATSGCKDAPR